MLNESIVRELWLDRFDPMEASNIEKCIQLEGDMSSLHHIYHPKLTYDELKKSFEDYRESSGLGSSDDYLTRQDLYERFNKDFSPFTPGNYRSSRGEAPFLGRGLNGTAYLVEVGGEKYALKQLKSPSSVRGEIKPLLVGRGIDGISQIVAYDPAGGFIVTKLLSGVNFDDRPSLPVYSDSVLQQFLTRLKNMFDAGLSNDPKSGNFMDCEENGIQMLDYHLSNERSTFLGNLDCSIAMLNYHLAYRSDDFSWSERNAATRELSDRMIPMLSGLGITSDDISSHRWTFLKHLNER